jgi:hypothetical protein
VHGPFPAKMDGAASVAMAISTSVRSSATPQSLTIPQRSARSEWAERM